MFDPHDELSLPESSQSTLMVLRVRFVLDRACLRAANRSGVRIGGIWRVIGGPSSGFAQGRPSRR